MGLFRKSENEKLEEKNQQKIFESKICDMSNDRIIMLALGRLLSMGVSNEEDEFLADQLYIRSGMEIP